MSVAKKAQQAKELLAKATAAYVNAPPSPMKTKLNEACKVSTEYRMGPPGISKNSPKGKGALKKGAKKKSPTKPSPKKRSNGKTKGSNLTNPCDFLALHPYIRAEIYKYVLGDSTQADLEPSGLQHPKHLTNGYTIPAILEVCSSVRLEASQVWFPRTTFVYHQEKELFDWLRLIGPANRALVRTIRPDSIFISKRWAESCIVFTHDRLKTAGMGEVVEDAIEAAYWEKPSDGTSGPSGEVKWALIRGEKWNEGKEIPGDEGIEKEE